MKLHVKRSIATKGKFLGGADTLYVLHLKAEVPPDELALMARYKEGSFSRSDDLTAMQVENKIEGPEYISLEKLTQGVEFRGKALYKALAHLPVDIIEQYRAMLGRIQAQETWPGEETLSAPSD